MLVGQGLRALQTNPSSFAACSFVLLEEVVVITVPIFVTMPVMTGNEPFTLAVLLLENEETSFERPHCGMGRNNDNFEKPESYRKQAISGNPRLLGAYASCIDRLSGTKRTHATPSSNHRISSRMIYEPS